MQPNRQPRSLYEILPAVESVERELSQLDLTTLQSIHEIAEFVEQTISAITKWRKELENDEELTTIPITAIENIEYGVVLLIEKLLRKRDVHRLLGEKPAIIRIFDFSECDENVRFVEARMKWFKGRIAQIIKRQYRLIPVTA